MVPKGAMTWKADLQDGSYHITFPKIEENFHGMVVEDNREDVHPTGPHTRIFDMDQRGKPEGQDIVHFFMDIHLEQAGVRVISDL